jgi:hypothetical protein
MPATSMSSPRSKSNSVCEGTTEIIRFGALSIGMLLPIWSTNTGIKFLLQDKDKRMEKKSGRDFLRLIPPAK